MEHRLHLYYGTGKGKTTAAMGLALRALGHGNRVLVAQFMKDGRSGELEAFRHFPNALVYDSARVKGFVSRMDGETRARTALEQTEQTWALCEIIRGERPGLMVLDELAVAWAQGMVEEAAAISLVETALSCGETVTTGRYAPDWLLEHADYVSRMEAQKHPYQTEGLQARKGVEW